MDDAAKKVAKMTDKEVQDKYKEMLNAIPNTEADFVCLRLVGADPNAENKSVEECAEVAKKVADAIDLPLVVAGCGVAEKDGKVFAKVAEVLEGQLQ